MDCKKWIRACQEYWNQAFDPVIDFSPLNSWFLEENFDYLRGQENWLGLTIQAPHFRKRIFQSIEEYLTPVKHIQKNNDRYPIRNQLK